MKIDGQNQCMACVHFWGFGECEAFPDGIPDDIYKRGEAHTTQWGGEQVLFELDPKREHLYEMWRVRHD